VHLEAVGLPAILFCSTPFMTLAIDTASALGRRDLRLLEFPHPLAGLSPAELKERYELASERLLQLFEHDRVIEKRGR
jgi:hypothetical protein